MLFKSRVKVVLRPGLLFSAKSTYCDTIVVLIMHAIYNAFELELVGILKPENVNQFEHFVACLHFECSPIHKRFEHIISNKIKSQYNFNIFHISYIYGIYINSNKSCNRIVKSVIESTRSKLSGISIH